MTAMQELRKDLVESILKINNRLDFLDNVSDPKVKELCTIMVNVTLESIIKSIDSELLEMEKQQIIEAVSFGDCRGRVTTYLTDEQYYNETYGSKGSETN